MCYTIQLKNKKEEYKRGNMSLPNTTSENKKSCAQKEYTNFVLIWHTSKSTDKMHLTSP